MNSALQKYHAVHAALREHLGSLTSGEAEALYPEFMSRREELAAAYPRKGFFQRLVSREPEGRRIQYLIKDVFQAIAANETSKEDGKKYDHVIGLAGDLLAPSYGSIRWKSPKQVRSGIIFALMKEPPYQPLLRDVEIICDFLTEKFSLDLTYEKIKAEVEEKHRALRTNLGRHDGEGNGRSR